MKLGAYVYSVNLEMEPSKKIYMTDENGVQWYRYNSDTAKLVVVEYRAFEVAGIIKRDFIGYIPEIHEFSNCHEPYSYLELERGNFYIVRDQKNTEFRIIYPSDLDEKEMKIGGTYYFSSEDKMNAAVEKINKKEI